MTVPPSICATSGAPIRLDVVMSGSSGDGSSGTLGFDRDADSRAAAIPRSRESAARVIPGVPDEPSPDDPDITTSSLIGAPLVAQMLGGTVIDEQLDDGTS